MIVLKHGSVTPTGIDKKTGSATTIEQFAWMKDTHQQELTDDSVGTHTTWYSSYRLTHGKDEVKIRKASCASRCALASV